MLPEVPRFASHAPAVAALLCASMLAGCGWRGEPAPLANREQAAPGLAPAASESDVASESEPGLIESAGEPRMSFVRSYARGCQQAQSLNKPMLVFFTAEWCHYCHQMASEAFGQRGVVQLSQNFVCVMVDADAEQDVCRQFRVQAFPTVQFVSVRGVPLNRIVGKKPSRDVMAAMHAALQSVARRPAGAEARQH